MSQSDLLTINDALLLAEVFKQLGDPTRLRIFLYLCHTKENVLGIAQVMDMSSPAVSHHLRLLKASGLIESHRQGKEMYYQAKDTPIAESLHHMIEDIEKITCPNTKKDVDKTS